jgi:hypothetical protein
VARYSGYCLEQLITKSTRSVLGPWFSSPEDRNPVIHFLASRALFPSDNSKRLQKKLSRSSEHLMAMARRELFIDLACFAASESLALYVG